MDFLKGFTTLDEVGEDSQVRKQNFKPATAAEEIEYLNVILANIEKQNAKDNSSVDLIPNGNDNSSSVTLKQNRCSDVEGSNTVTCELSHVDDILTQARRRDHHMLNNNLGDSVNGHVQCGLSTEPTTHVLLNSSSQDSDDNFSHSCVSADVDEDLNINVGAISLAILNHDDCQGYDEAGSSELSPSTADASLIIHSGLGVDEGGEVLESGYDPARDTSYGCLSGKEDLAVSDKESSLEEKPVATNIVLRGIHELLADTATGEPEHSAICENVFEQSATSGETVEQLGPVLKESVDQSSACVGSFEESGTSCEESFDQATVCDESFDQAAVCEESFDQSTIGCNESFDQSTACEVSFDQSSVFEDSFEQSVDACGNTTEQSIFVGEKQNHIDLSIVKSEPLDADPGEDFDFDAFIHDPGENFRIKEEPRSEDEMQDYTSSVDPGMENVALYNIKMEESESAEPYVPEQRFKVKSKFYNKEQLTAAYLISQSTLSASVDMEMFRGIGKTEPVLKLYPLEAMIKKPKDLVAEEADIVKLFVKNFGCNIDEWKVKHKFKQFTARKHTIKIEKSKKSPRGKRQKEKSPKNQVKGRPSDSAFCGFDSDEMAKGKKGKLKNVDHSKVSGVIKENSVKKKSHKKKDSKDKPVLSDLDSGKKRKKKQRTLSREVIDSNSSDSEPEHRNKKQQKVSDSYVSNENVKKLSLKKELKGQLECKELKVQLESKELKVQLDSGKAMHKDSSDSDSGSNISETLQNESEDASIESQVGNKEGSKIRAKRKSSAEDLKCEESELADKTLGVGKDASDKETKQSEYCSLDRDSEIKSNEVEGFAAKGEGSKDIREENESEKDDLTDGELNLNVSDIISRLEVEEESTSSDCVDIKNKATFVSGADETDVSAKKESETEFEKSSLKAGIEKFEQDEKLLDGNENVKVCKDVEQGKSSPKHPARTEAEVVVKTENKLVATSENLPAGDDNSSRAQENDRIGTTVSEGIIIKDCDKCKPCVVSLTDLMLLNDYQKFVRKSLKRLGLQPKVQLQNMSPLKMLDNEISGEKSGREKSKETKEKNKKEDKERVKEDKEPEIRRKKVDRDKRFLKDLEEERVRRHLEKMERKAEKDRKRQLEEEEKNSPQLQFPTMETNFSFKIPKKKGSTSTYLQELRHKAKSVTSVVSKREDLKKSEKTSMYASTKTFLNRRDDRKKDRVRREDGFEQDDIRQDKQNNQSWKVDSKTGMKRPPSPPVSPAIGEWVPSRVEGKEAQRELENVPNQSSSHHLNPMPDMGGWNAAGDGMEEDNHFEDDYMDNDVANSPDDNYCFVGKESLEKRAEKPSMLEFVHGIFEKPHEEVSMKEKPSLLSFVNELFGKNDRKYDSPKEADVNDLYIEDLENRKIDQEKNVENFVDKKYLDHSKDGKGANDKDFVDGPTTFKNSGEGIDHPNASTSSSASVEPSFEDAQSSKERKLFFKVLAMEEEETKAAAGEGKNIAKVSSVAGLDENQENVPSMQLEAAPDVSLHKDQPSDDSVAKDIEVPVEVVVSKKEISPGVYLVKKTRPPGAPAISQRSRESLSGVQEKEATVNAEALSKAKMLALPTVGDNVMGIKEPRSLEGEAASATGEEEDDSKGKLDYSSLDRRQKIKLYEKRKKAYYEAKKKFLKEKTQITSHQQKRARFEECERLKKEYYDLKMHLYNEKKREEAKKREEHEKHKKAKPDIKHNKAKTSERRRQSTESKVDEYDPENAPLLELPPDPDDNDAPYSPTGSPIVDEIYHINTRTSLLDDQQSSFKESIAKLEKIQKGKLNTITEGDSENLQSMVLALLENIKQIPVNDTRAKVPFQSLVTDDQSQLRAKSVEPSSVSLDCGSAKSASVASMSANISSVSVTSTTVSLTTTSVTSSVVSTVKSSVSNARTLTNQPIKVPISSNTVVYVPVSSSSCVPTPVPPPIKSSVPTPVPPPIKSSVPTPVPPPNRLMPMPVPAPVTPVLTSSSSSFPTPVPPSLSVKLLPTSLLSQLTVPEKAAQSSLPTNPPGTDREVYQSHSLQPTIPEKEARSSVSGKAQFLHPEEPPVPPQPQVPGREVQPPPPSPEPQPPPPPDELQPPPPPPPEESDPPPPPPPEESKSPHVEACTPNLPFPSFTLPPPNLSSDSSSNSAISTLTTLAPPPIPALKPPPPPPYIPSMTEMLDSVPMDLDSDMECESGGEEEPILIVSEYLPKVNDGKSIENISYSSQEISYNDDASFLASFGVKLGSPEIVCEKLDSPEIECEAPSLSDVVWEYFSQKPRTDTPVSKLASTNPNESNDIVFSELSDRPVSSDTVYSISSTPSHTSGISKTISHSKDTISYEKDLAKKLFSEDEILENVQGTDEVDLEVIFTNVKKDKRKTVGDEALNYYQKTTLAQSIIDQCKDVPLVGLQYVLEVRPNARTILDDAFYICSLCSKKMDAHTLLAHIKSVPHRLKFSEIHCRDVYAKFGSITLKQWTAVLVKEFTDALLDVEAKFGRHKLAVAYEKDMSVVLASLKSKIEDMTELSLSQKKQDKNSSSRDSRGSRKGDHSKSSSPKRKRSRSPRRSPRRRSRDRGDRSGRGGPGGPKRRRSRSLSRSRSPRGRRHRSRSRSPRHRSPQRRGDRRGRHSPGRRSEERRKQAEKRRVEDFRHAEQRLRQRQKELEEEFDRCPESHPKYNEEWALFWERRYRELEAQGLDPSRHDFKSEWAVFWRKRMKELNFILWDQKRNGLLSRFGITDPGPPVEDNLGSVNGTSKKQLPLSRIDRSPSPWEEDNSRSAKNPSPPPQNSGALNIIEPVGSGSDSKSSIAICEEEYSVIGTLKLLNELEDHLGSFGPAVATLLSKALTLKEKGENPLDLFKDLDNSVLIRYAKEKLASQISAGILGGKSLAKTESAIERSMWLQIQAEKLTGRDKYLGLDINKIAKSTIGMDTVQIAQYIAHHLLQIGKSNASEEDLQNILVAVSASHVEMLANLAPVVSNSSNENDKGRADMNQKNDADSVVRPVSVPENASVTTSATQAPKTALFPSGDPSTQAQTSAANSATKTEATNKSGGSVGLSLLQSAYEDEGPKDMNKLSLDDLQALLGDFRSLSREEQQALTSYLKKLEATDSKKVTQLRERMQKSAAKPTPKPSPSISKPTPSHMSPVPRTEGKKDPVITPTSNAVPSQTTMAANVPAGPSHPADANLNSNTFQPNSRLPPHSPNNRFPASNVLHQENFSNHGPQFDRQSRSDVPENRTPPVPSNPVADPARGLENLLHDYRMSSSSSFHKEGDPRSKEQPTSQNMPPHAPGFNNPDLRGGANDGRDLNRPMPSEMRENQTRGPYNDREPDFQGPFNDREREYRGPYDQREPNQQGRFDAREPGFQGSYDNRGPYGNREPDMHRPFDGEGNIGRPYDNADMVRMRDPMMDRGNPGFQGPGYPHRGFPDQGNPNFQDRGFDERSRGMPFRDYREAEFPPRDSMGMYDQRPGDSRAPIGQGNMSTPLRDMDFNNRFAGDGPSPSFSRGPLPFEADEFATDTFRSGAALPQPRGPMQPRGYMDPRPPYQGRW